MKLLLDQNQLLRDRAQTLLEFEARPTESYLVIS